MSSPRLWIIRATERLERLEDPERNPERDTEVILEAVACALIALAEQGQDR